MIALTIILGIGLLWLLKILVYDRLRARREQYKANQALLATETKPYRGTRSERRLVLSLLLNNFFQGLVPRFVFGHDPRPLFS
ncbi:MAG: hypothetical protein ACKO55_13600, partial [Bacteroidota bacterium]